LRIDERALRLSSSSPGTRQKPGYATDTEESPQSTATEILPSITRRNRLLETHTLTYLLKEPEKLYQLNRQLGILDLPLVSSDDFQESDCKLAFGIVQDSLEQDAEPALDYIEQHLPDIFDMDEPTEQDALVLKPSQSKSFYEQFRSFLRIRKNLIEDRVQEIQFLQADEEARPYSKDEADKLYLDLLTQRRIIDRALASALLPEDSINRNAKMDKKHRRK